MRSSGKFWEPVQIVGGPRTRAILQRGSDTDRPGDIFTVPKLTCRVRPDSLVQTGQVITLFGQNQYLVGDHSSTDQWRTHHLFECDRSVTWQRSLMQTDPITRLERGQFLADQGTPWVHWERVSRNQYDLALRLDLVTYLVLTGEDVQLNDIIDGHQVFRVDKAMGLTVLGVKI